MRDELKVVLGIASAIAACVLKEYIVSKVETKRMMHDISDAVHGVQVSQGNQIKTIRVTPDSEAEKELMECIKYTKDGVVCRIGAMFGWDYNEYDISQDDINRIVERSK